MAALACLFIGQYSYAQQIGTPWQNAKLETTYELFLFDDFSFFNNHIWQAQHHTDQFGVIPSVNLTRNVTITPNGQLRLDVVNESYFNPENQKTYEYTSSVVATKPDYFFRYGKIEARIAFPYDSVNNTRLWCAFWLYSFGERTNAGEVDIVEVYGEKPPNHLETNVHLCYQHNNPECPQTGTKYLAYHTVVPEYANAFRTYGLEYTPTTLNFYYEGQLIRSMPNPGVVDCEQLIFDNWVKHSVTPFAPNVFSMLVDWVRVYTYASDTGKEPYIINPANDPGNPGMKQVTLMWQLPCICARDYSHLTTDYTSCTVEYGTSPLFGNPPVVIPDNGIDHRYSLRLSNLKPETRYYYKVTVDGKNKSYTGSFVTPPDNDAVNTVFYATGAAHNHPESTFNDLCRELLHQIKATPNGQTLLLHTGNLVSADNPLNWNTEWFDPALQHATKLRANIPFISMIGSNERRMDDLINNQHVEIYTGGNFRKHYPFNYADRGGFYNPALNAADHSYQHSFYYGPVHFVFPEIISPTSTAEYQLLWADMELFAGTRPWKILGFHYPVKTPFGEPENSGLADKIHRLAVEHGVQLVIMGHAKYYAHWVEEGVHYLILGNGGADSVEVDELTLGDPPLLGFSTAPHFARFSIEENLMVIEVMQGVDMNDQEAGHTIERFTIHQTKPTSPPHRRSDE